nr:hypothetical protein [Microbacterium barkeri]
MTTIKPTLTERLIAPFKRLTKGAEDEYQARLLHRLLLASMFGISEDEARAFRIIVERGTGNVLIYADFSDAEAAQAYAEAAGMTLSGHSARYISLTR